MVMPGESMKWTIVLTEWVKLHLYDPSNFWTSKTVCTIITPSLCTPVILGLPFLTHNTIIVDHMARTATDKSTGFNLLHPSPPPPPPPPKQKLKDFFAKLKEDRKLMVAELKMICTEQQCKIRNHFEPVKPVDCVTAICQCIEELNTHKQLNCLSDSIKSKYKDVFDPFHTSMNHPQMSTATSN